MISVFKHSDETAVPIEKPPNHSKHRSSSSSSSSRTSTVSYHTESFSSLCQFSQSQIQFPFVSVSKVMVTLWLFDVLPKYIVIPILADWLNTEDVCNLDSALCNKRFRPIMLTYIAHEKVSFEGLSDLKKPCYYIHWLKIRKISVRQLFINKVSISQLKEVLNSRISTSDKLQNLTISLSGNLSTHLTLLESSFSNLTSLTLDHCVGLSLEYVKRVSFPLLGHLSVAAGDILDTLIELIAANSRQIATIELRPLGGQIGRLKRALLMVATHCKQLQSIVITKVTADTAIDVSAEDLLQACNHLTSLNFNRSSAILTVPTISAIIAMNCRIKRLELEHCNHLTDNLLITIAQKCRMLTHLKIRNIYQLSNASIKVVATQCKELQIFKTTCRDVSHNTLFKFLCNCKDLRELSLQEMSIRSYDVPSYHIRNSSNMCVHLHTLTLTNSESITDSVLLIIANNSPNLTHIQLSNVTCISDKSLLVLASCCVTLQHVSLNGCNLVTNTTIHALATHCLDLRCLDMRECANITVYKLFYLLKQSRNMERIVYSRSPTSSGSRGYKEEGQMMKIIRKKFPYVLIS